ncbi:MAG TPA: response regulator [Anaerolineales bacterium]|nr:response regulator [Anaerolineales bacterium]
MARILVIEDNPTNLELMVYLLKAFGHEPLIAMDGETGLGIVQHESPDLIICDIHLPRMDGYEIARRLKNHPALREIPLIAVTALAMMGDRDKVLRAGFDGYIAKPIAPENFVSQVETFLPPEQRQGMRPVSVEDNARTDPFPAKRATLLLVDNRYENIEVLRAMLEPTGIEVIVAAGVTEALASAYQTRPDLILSDVYLTGETGHDLIKVVKADPTLRSIPFLFISSTDWAEREAAYALAEGAAGYITRPIEPERLLAQINQWLKSE